MMRRVLLLLFLVSSCGGTKKLATTAELNQDTTSIAIAKVMPYKSLDQLQLAIGETFTLPDLNLKVTRIDSTRALIESEKELVTQVKTRVQLVATKQIDRSKDKSIKGSTVGSKVKDKSRENSGNKTKKSANEKVKQNNKQVSRGMGFVLPLLLGALLITGLIYRWWKRTQNKVL